MNKRTLNNKSSFLVQNETGGVIVEMSIGFFLIVLLTLGVLETGRLIFQIPWVSQTLYEIVLTGAENQSNVGVTRMNQRSAQFTNELNKSLASFNLNAGYATQSFTSGGNPYNMEVVTGTVNGDLIPFTNLFDFKIGLHYVVAHEATQPALDASMMLPGLIQNQYYHCDGTQCPSAGAPCEAAECCDPLTSICLP